MKSSSAFIHAIKQHIQQLPNHEIPHIEVALSGGLDSVVLLHVLHTLRAECFFRLSAVHVHHGLQAAADSWAKFCEQLCRQYQIDFRLEKVKVESKNQGLEAAARQARYQAFSRSQAHFIALAHHADDQTETFFLAALRGGGVRALSAMPVFRQEGEKWLWRPLLAYSRQELADYAQEHGLSYVQDDSNDNPSFLRNWLRKYGLAAWRLHLPHLDKHVHASIALLQDELNVLNEIRLADYQWIHHQGYFDCRRWRQLSEARRRMQLLHFAQHHHLGTPSRSSLNNFAHILCNEHTSTAEWQLPKGNIYLYRQRLLALSNQWKKVLSTPKQGKLAHLLTKEQGWIVANQSAKWLQEQGCIRPAQATDFIRMAHGHKKVSKLLQEKGIPPFMRPYWPVLLNQQGQCLAVANIYADAEPSERTASIPIYQALQNYCFIPK